MPVMVQQPTASFAETSNSCARSGCIRVGIGKEGPLRPCLITGAYGAGTAMIKVQKKGDGGFDVAEVFRNPEVGSHTRPPILHEGHFYSHYTVNERNDGLVAMGLDGQIKWKTDQQPPFVRGGSILADGLMLVRDGNTKLYLVEPTLRHSSRSRAPRSLLRATTGRPWRSSTASCSSAARRN